MRPSEFDDDEIVIAGKRLAETGKRITGFALRKFIGGGNPERLKKVWDTYIESTKEGDLLAIHSSLPAEFEESIASLNNNLERLAVKLFEKAQEVAESRVRDTLKSMKMAEEQAHAELEDAFTTIQEAESENAAFLKNIESIQAEITKLKDDNALLRGTLSAENEHGQALARNLTELTAELIEVRSERDIALGKLSLLKDEIGDTNGREKAPLVDN